MRNWRTDMWVIEDPDGNYCLFTISSSRGDAIKKLRAVWVKPITWGAYYKQGYRCKKVHVADGWKNE